MRSFYRPPLAVLVLLTIVSFFLILVVTAYVYERDQIHRQLIQEHSQRLDKSLARLQYVVAETELHGGSHRLKTEVSLASTDLQVLVLLLLDKQHVIKHANYLVWRGSVADNFIDGYQAKLHQEAIEQQSSILQVNPLRKSIQAYYPIFHSKKNPKIDLIYLEFDLTPVMLTADSELRERYLWFWGLAATLGMGFMGLLYLWVIRPLNQLSAQLKGYIAAGSSASQKPVSMRPIAWSCSEVAQLQSAMHENLEQKQKLQQKLQDYEYRWFYAVESSGNGIWDWNIITGAVYFSNRWKEMLGFQQHEINDDFQEWESRVHPDDKEAVMLKLQAYISGTHTEFESIHRLKHKLGHYIWVMDRGMLVEWDCEGRPERIIGTHTDMTELMAAKEQPQ
ncbi:MAG: PAS domain-containing protein [Shewanella sp.]